MTDRNSDVHATILDAITRASKHRSNIAFEREELEGDARRGDVTASDGYKKASRELEKQEALVAKLYEALELAG